MDSGTYKYSYPDRIQIPEGSTYAYALAAIEPGARVLDVGSGPGHFALMLQERGCRVVCIEQNNEAAQRAEASGLEVLRLDAGKGGWSSRVDGVFDVVLALDVLEHLVEPHACLGEVGGLLVPEGRFVASVPNVAHAAVSLPLLVGQWRYEIEGILDDSHLRFFVKEGFADLLRAQGFELVRLDRVYRDAASDLVASVSRGLGVRRRRLERMLAVNEGYVWQYVATCVLADSRSGREGVGGSERSSLDRSVDLLEELSNLRNEVSNLRHEIDSAGRLHRSLMPLFRLRRSVRRLLRLDAGAGDIDGD